MNHDLYISYEVLEVIYTSKYEVLRIYLQVSNLMCTGLASASCSPGSAGPASEVFYTTTTLICRPKIPIQALKMHGVPGALSQAVIHRTITPGFDCVLMSACVLYAFDTKHEVVFFATWCDLADPREGDGYTPSAYSSQKSFVARRSQISSFLKPFGSSLTGSGIPFPTTAVHVGPLFYSLLLLYTEKECVQRRRQN